MVILKRPSSERILPADTNVVPDLKVRAGQKVASARRGARVEVERVMRAAVSHQAVDPSRGRGSNWFKSAFCLVFFDAII